MFNSGGFRIDAWDSRFHWLSPCKNSYLTTKSLSLHVLLHVLLLEIDFNPTLNSDSFVFLEPQQKDFQQPKSNKYIFRYYFYQDSKLELLYVDDSITWLPATLKHTHLPIFVILQWFQQHEFWFYQYQFRLLCNGFFIYWQAFHWLERLHRCRRQVDIGDFILVIFECWCPTLMLKDRWCWWQKRPRP